jgi:hypothetical protein
MARQPKKIHVHRHQPRLLQRTPIIITDLIENLQFRSRLLRCLSSRHKEVSLAVEAESYGNLYPKVKAYDSNCTYCQYPIISKSEAWNCQTCGMVQPSIVEPNQNEVPLVYSRLNHFTEVLAPFNLGQKSKIPQEVVKSIKNSLLRSSFKMRCKR